MWMAVLDFIRSVKDIRVNRYQWMPHIVTAHKVKYAQLYPMITTSGVQHPIRHSC